MITTKKPKAILLKHAEKYGAKAFKSWTRPQIVDAIVSVISFKREQRRKKWKWIADHTFATENDVAWNLYTPDQWKQLGYLPDYRPAGVPTYRSSEVTAWSWVGPDRVPYYAAGKAIHAKSRDITAIRAVASDMGLTPIEALRQLNKHGKFNHKNYYTLKDTILNELSDKVIYGAVTRVETQECWTCDGRGYYSDTHNECWSCGGDGIYRTSTLYEWRFKEGEQEYSFHSYQKPPRIDETHNNQCRNFGRRITDFTRWKLTPHELELFLQDWRKDKERVKADNPAFLHQWMEARLDKLPTLMSQEERREIYNRRIDDVRRLYLLSL